jgi:hypothetical protein
MKILQGKTRRRLLSKIVELEEKLTTYQGAKSYKIRNKQSFNVENMLISETKEKINLLRSLL